VTSRLQRASFCLFEIAVEAHISSFEIPACPLCALFFDTQVGIEDAIHTALLTLKEGFEGQVSGNNIEVRPVGRVWRARERACARARVCV
jgi:hypothetical protein